MTLLGDPLAVALAVMVSALLAAPALLPALARCDHRHDFILPWLSQVLLEVRMVGGSQALELHDGHTDTTALVTW